MKCRMLPVLLSAMILIPFPGCAKKADPKKPIERVRQEAAAMSLAQLETQASDYADAIRAQKLEIQKIQQKIAKMPMEKVFKDRSMTRRITEIGREAEALLARYQIYAQTYQAKGGDLSKIQIETLKT